MKWCTIFLKKISGILRTYRIQNQKKRIISIDILFGWQRDVMCDKLNKTKKNDWTLFQPFLPFFLLFFSSLCLCLRRLYSLSLDVIIFVLVSYCWHFNSGAPQSGLTQTARNRTSQPSLTALLVASNFSQIKRLFYLSFFRSLLALWENKPYCFSLICRSPVAFPCIPHFLFPLSGHKAALCVGTSTKDRSHR